MENQLITFTPLKPAHFPLLLKWINADHVAKWWRDNRIWTLDDIVEKYETYTEGYKLAGDTRKPIHAFIIECDAHPIGYIQYYDAYDFPRESGPLTKDLADSVAALDLYIGELKFTGKGLGPQIMTQFMNVYIAPSFRACFVDPDKRNLGAIRAYEKAGFQPIPSPHKGNDVWMIKA